MTLLLCLLTMVITSDSGCDSNERNGTDSFGAMSFFQPPLMVPPDSCQIDLKSP
jgi:hypothetical protein